MAINITQDTISLYAKNKEEAEKWQKIFEYHYKAVDILIGICGILNTDKYPEDVQDDIIDLLEQNGIKWKGVNQDGSFKI